MVRLFFCIFVVVNSFNMTNTEHFEEKAKKLLSTLKENFDSIGAGDNFYYDDLTTIQPEEKFETEVEEISSAQQETVVPVEKPPKFRIYWRAWKDGNNTSGETESTLETAQMARAEAMSKLYDLGFNDIEVLAIETVKQPNEEIESVLS